MEILFHVDGATYKADSINPLDISIPVRFDAPQLSVFGSSPAKREAYKAGGFTGDVRSGGSCNCDVYTFSPHLNGTHTECVGHITTERISVCDVLKDSMIPATLVTLLPERGAKDSYIPPARNDDRMITKSALQKTLSPDNGFLQALVIRTLPNNADKKICDYNKTPPSFLSNDAMEYISSLGVSHLLVDIPSVDRPDDDGKLSSHRVFWKNKERTITELIYVPDDIKDGQYLLNLQIASMEGDAVPSRPVLFRIKKS